MTFAGLLTTMVTSLFSEMCILLVALLRGRRYGSILSMNPNDHGCARGDEERRGLRGRWGREGFGWWSWSSPTGSAYRCAVDDDGCPLVGELISFGICLLGSACGAWSMRQPSDRGINQWYLYDIVTRRCSYLIMPSPVVQVEPIPRDWWRCRAR